jgi:hypothetical protein
MDPGTEYNGFHAYLRPNGVVGNVGFRYVWYDMANENDQHYGWTFISTRVLFGVGENAGAGSFDIYPNPAIGQDITLDYALNSDVQSVRSPCSTCWEDPCSHMRSPHRRVGLILPAARTETGCVLRHSSGGRSTGHCAPLYRGLALVRFVKKP